MTDRNCNLQIISSPWAEGTVNLLLHKSRRELKEIKSAECVFVFMFKVPQADVSSNHDKSKINSLAVLFFAYCENVKWISWCSQLIVT